MQGIKKAFKFFGLSGIGWIIDFLVFNILITIFGFDLEISNRISSIVGVSFVFFTSTRKLFINYSKINLKIKYVIYILYQLILIFLASKGIVLLKDLIVGFSIDILVQYANIIAKILITPLTMLINYLMMKLLIEKI